MRSTSRTRAAIGIAVIVGVIGVAFMAGNASGGSSNNNNNNNGASGGASPAATAPAGDDSPDAASAAVDAPDLPDRGPHPELVDIEAWLQSDVTSLEELQGKVVAVQFWTFGCSNCKATLPRMSELYQKYQDQGFEIVGVHAPEFEFEADQANIVEAAAELGVTWPIALDTTKRTFHLWQEGPTAHWPRIYLIDRDGHIRYDHIGEGRYDQIDAAVQALLAEPA